MLKPDNLPVTFGKNDVEIIARETLYRGFFSLDLYRFRHRLFNGQMSHEVRREIFEVTPQSCYPLTQCVMKLC
jgi:ADP-ribose pyrophosphatase